MISRPIGENYATALAEPIRPEALPGACFSFNQAATSSGSKRTDLEVFVVALEFMVRAENYDLHRCGIP